ncbi:MAG: hypothetical protein CMJ78_10880 [Planctomycetaceae bacterium]|nr:hypothetical protein [Planctomycetaceae bacterium]
MSDDLVRVLLVDDDEDTFIVTRELLTEVEGRKVEFEWAAGFDAGLEVIARQEHDVYLIDHRLGLRDGLELLNEAIARDCQAPMIMLTGQVDQAADLQAMKAGAADYLVKDTYDVSRLERSIRYALERQRLLNDLDRERYLLSLLMNNLPDSIYFKDEQSQFIRVSKALAARFGVENPDEVIGKTDADYFSEEHAKQARNDELKLMGSGGALSLEEKETFPDGGIAWVATTKLPLKGRDGALVGTFGISRDITEQKQAEFALRENERRMSLIIESALNAFVGMDGHGVIVDWNAQAERTFGWQREEVLGKQLEETLIPPRFRDEHKQGLTQFLKSGDDSGTMLNQRIETVALHADGHEFPVEMTIAPIALSDGYLFSAFIHDISNRKQAEQDLRQAKDAAESANRAKSDFLANMSHEIRTPMNAIIGMTELVMDTTLDETQREYLTMVQQSSEALLELINDILDFSKIEAGKLELDETTFGLRECLGDTMRSLAVRAHREDLELAAHFNSDIPELLIGDINRLRQIVVNLVGNAIKFTHKGEIVLDVAMNSQSEDEVELLISVSDTGIGIPQEKLATVFQRFEQADTSTTRRYGGTGLGLAIVSQLVQLMQGRICVESELGKGSTFSFTSRFGIAAESVQIDLDPSTVQGTRVLVVDDNATNRHILEEMLTNWGMVAQTVGSAGEALQTLYQSCAPGDEFQLIVSDVNVPDIDGFMLVEEMKRDFRFQDITVLMLTSGERANDLQRSRELGVDGHLMKPVKQSELLDAIVKVLGVQSLADDFVVAPGEEVASREDQLLALMPKLDILLAEDSLANQRLAVGLLEKWGHQISVANNGREAIEMSSEHDYDIVLMDVQMPELDGLEATGAIREIEQTTGKHIPIVAMTAHAMKGDREQCLESGMDGYVAKPIRVPHLLEALAEFFVDANKIVGQESPPVVTTPTESVPAEPAKSEVQPATPRSNDLLDLARPVELFGTSSGRDDVGGMDLDQALESVAGDAELLRDVARAFLQECPVLVNDLNHAVESLDGGEVKKTAHTLKSSLNMFGAAEASSLAKQLEEMGRSQSLDRAKSTVDAILAEISEVVRVLTEFVDDGQNR